MKKSVRCYAELKWRFKEFLSYEIQPFPSSCSDFGKHQLLGTKSELLHCIDPKSSPYEQYLSNCRDFDGALTVQCLPITDASTSDEYALKICILYVERQPANAERIDKERDVYLADSLKTSWRGKRGKIVKRKMADLIKVPNKKWNDFFHVSENKQELVSFLINKVKQYEFPEEHIVVITDVQSVGVVRTKLSEIAFLSCNHQEADTRIVVHIRHAMALCTKRLQVRTVNTEVILMGNFTV